jgi:hypothetical protein
MLSVTMLNVLVLIVVAPQVHQPMRLKKVKGDIHKTSYDHSLYWGSLNYKNIT